MHNQQFVAERITAEPGLRIAVENEAEHRRGDGHQRDITVAHLCLHKDTEGKEAQNGSVGIAGQRIDGVDDTRVVQQVEDEDNHTHHHGHADMHPLAQMHHLLFALPLHAQNIDRKRGGERRQGRPRSRIGRRNETHDKQDAHNQREVALRGYQRKEFVALLRNGYPLGSGIDIEQHAQHQEEGIDKELRDAARNHVFLRIPGVLATQVALHHILVEPVHGNHREDTGQELLEEIALVVHIVEVEHLRHLRPAYRLPQPAQIEVQVAGDIIDAEYHRNNEAHGLERIGPDERLHPAPEGVEPHQSYGENHIQDKGQMQRLEDQHLQHHAHQEEAYGGAQHLRNKEKPGPRAIRREAEPVLEILINRNQIHAVEQRHQHVGDEQLPHDEPQYHLQIRESAGGHHTGHRDEGHPRNHGTDHGESHHIPGRLAIAHEKTLIVGPVTYHIRNAEQDDKISENGD